MFPLEDDGRVALEDPWAESPADRERVDPWTASGCEELCEQSVWGDVTRVDRCEAASVSLVDAAGDTWDPDWAEVDDGAPGAVPGVEIACVYHEMWYFKGRHTALLAHRPRASGATEVGRWLAGEAAAEAGSVHAFRQLVRELLHHGAPRALVDAARAAAADEVRHTRLMRAQAARFGGVPVPVRARAAPPRSLLDLALENAVEACVHETFAAARGLFQARHGADPTLRALDEEIAQDELRHADLGEAVHAWALGVLPREQAARVEEARVAAWGDLAQNPAILSPRAMAFLGLPDAATHRALVWGLSGALRRAA